MIWFIPFLGALGLLLIPLRDAEGAPSNIGTVIGKKVVFPREFEANGFGQKGGFDNIFLKYGGLYGINAKVLKSIAIQESSLNPNAKAITSSATGLMQITKAAAADVGEDWNDQRNPETSIRTGAKYLRLQMDQFSFTLEQAIQAYYAGAGTILKGDMGEAFTLPWQSAAYLFAKNVYQPKILQRASTITV